MIVADLVMSLDNVLGVAAAAKGSLLLLIFGLVSAFRWSIVGSQLIMKLIERFPMLIVAGGGLLGYVAGEMIVAGPGGRRLGRTRTPHGCHWAIPIAGIVLVVVRRQVAGSIARHAGAETRLEAGRAPAAASLGRPYGSATADPINARRRTGPTRPLNSRIPSSRIPPRCLADDRSALDVASLSHPGMVRSHNEDAVFVDGEAGLAVLADGMGGYNAGEVASGIAVNVVSERHAARARVRAASCRRSTSRRGLTHAALLLQQQIAAANKGIYEAAQTRPECAGMGTTHRRRGVLRQPRVDRPHRRLALLSAARRASSSS